MLGGLAVESIAEVPQVEPETSTRAATNRRRFTAWAIAAVVVSAVPYLWTLFTLWNDSPNVLRKAYPNGYGGDFYDLQARAMLSGHLYVPNGSLAIEAWTYHGHQYTYFGVFPSLLRIPVLLLTHSLDGKLTACSVLLAWLVTAAFTATATWRIRVMVRGDSILGRTEAAALGLLISSVLLGSVLVFLAANPYVYSEDKAWSVALSLGGFFALLGMLERPSWGRTVMCAVLIVAANLTRLTDGYACVVGAVFVAIWFAMGRCGAENRRWWRSMAVIALVSIAIGSAINWAKSGSFFGLPVSEYTAFHVLHEASINGGHYFSILYFPSTLYAYFQPGGLRITRLFPFLTLPGGPTGVIGNVMFDNRTRTASIPASMPLLFLSGCLGVVSVFRRGARNIAAILRIILIAAASGTAAVLFYGWIADRYLADFLPFFILAAAVGLIFLWMRLDAASRRVRVMAVSVVAIAALFSAAANVGSAITPSDAWTSTQASNFLNLQKTISDVTGHPLASQIHRGNQLPFWAPADTVFIAGDCQALYVSNGQDYRGILDQEAEHRTWVVVERSSQLEHVLNVTFHSPPAPLRERVKLATFGTGRLWMNSEPGSDGRTSVWFSLQDPVYATNSVVASVEPNSTHKIALTTDQFANVLNVTLDHSTLLNSPVSHSAPAVIVQSESPGNSVSLSKTPVASSMRLCRNLIEDG
jgi:hypothetical protein